jgi:hypothetical protein
MHITHVFCVILLAVLYTRYWWVYLVAIDLAHQYVKELYGLGLQRIGVFSAPPLGCLPSQKTLNGYLGKGCVNYLNEASKLFNAKLSAEMGCLNNNLPNARVVYIDIYNPLLEIVQNPKKYGNISFFFIFFKRFIIFRFNLFKDF